jgi:hypothetical protein
MGGYLLASCMELICMQEEPSSTARKRKIHTRAFSCAELLILEPGSIRKGADLENGVKIALVELCQHLMYGRVV